MANFQVRSNSRDSRRSRRAMDEDRLTSAGVEAAGCLVATFGAPRTVLRRVGRDQGLRISSEHPPRVCECEIILGMYSHRNLIISLPDVHYDPVPHRVGLVGPFSVAIGRASIRDVQTTETRLVPFWPQSGSGLHELRSSSKPRLSKSWNHIQLDSIKDELHG